MTESLTLLLQHCKNVVSAITNSTTLQLTHPIEIEIHDTIVIFYHSYDSVFTDLVMIDFSKMSTIQFFNILYQYDETTQMFSILNIMLHRLVLKYLAFSPKEFLHLWRIPQLRQDILPNFIVYRDGILHYQDKQCNILSLLLKHKKLEVVHLDRYRSILENIRMLPDKDHLLPFDYIPDTAISSYYGQKLLPDWSPRYHRFHDPEVKATVKTFMTLLYVENTITNILSRELACAILKLI